MIGTLTSSENLKLKLWNKHIWISISFHLAKISFLVIILTNEEQRTVLLKSASKLSFNATCYTPTITILSILQQFFNNYYRCNFLIGIYNGLSVLLKISLSLHSEGSNKKKNTAKQ